MPDYSYIFSRKHPMLRANETQWDRAAAAFAGGEQYIQRALIRHISEPEPEFAERQNRAYYLNYPRRLAKLITAYVFSDEPGRTGADSELIADWSRSGLSADAVMQQASNDHGIFDIAWLHVDYPPVSAIMDPAGVVDIEAKVRANIRPFVRCIDPRDVKDWAYGEDGQLDWLIVEELHIDKSDPFAEPAKATRRRLWTRAGWFLFERQSAGNTIMIAKGAHNLGVVPFVPVVEPDGFDPQRFGDGAYWMESGVRPRGARWFEDVIRISDAIMNNESEAQMNVVKQMFGLLVIPEGFAISGGLPPTDDPDGQTQPFSHVLARSAAVWETQEQKGITRYVSPQGTENATIRAENVALKREMYDVVGMAWQSESREAQTAESKEWDASNVQRFLASRAGMFELAEKRCWEIMAKWDSSIKVPEVIYNRDFSVKDMQSEVTALIDLSSIEAGDEYKREIARKALDLLNQFGKIDEAKYQQIQKEIDTMEIETFPVPKQGIPVDDAENGGDNNNPEGNNE